MADRLYCALNGTTLHDLDARIHLLDVEELAPAVRTVTASRIGGGLHLLPPFGVNTRGDYTGTAEALNAVISYVRNIPEPEVVLMPADIVCNLDLAAAIAQHNASGCGITAICRDGVVTGEHHRYLTDEHGRVTKLITSAAAGAGVAAMEIYIVNKDVLLGMLDFCAQENRFLSLIHI